MCTLHHFTVHYMRALCHERCITKMMSKQLTSLSTFILHLQLGLTKGYYNPLSLFMHYPRCIIYPYTKKNSKILKKMWVFCLHCILILPSSILRNVPGPLGLYKPYGSIPELLDFPVQNVHRMHFKKHILSPPESHSNQ
jgi:hypothetical protein